MVQSVGEAATFTTPLSKKNSEVSRVRNRKTVDNLKFLPEAFRTVNRKTHPVLRVLLGQSY